jgi:HSP20 family molecular chaperone IbpA
MRLLVLEDRGLAFNCKNFDMKPSIWEKTDDGYKCTCRSVGINPEDLKVSIGDDYIHVEGETELDNYKYSVKYDLPVSAEILDSIKSVKYKTTNGITIIYIELEKSEKKKIKIEQI